MLYIPRWKAIAILLTAGICCLFAIPNFLPEKTIQRWPAWAQRHIVLGLDLQGGASLLWEVDSAALTRAQVTALRDDARGKLRDGRISISGGIAVLPRASTPSPDIVEIAVDDDHLVRQIAIGWMANRFLPPSAASFRDSALAWRRTRRARHDTAQPVQRARGSNARRKQR